VLSLTVKPHLKPVVRSYACADAELAMRVIRDPARLTFHGAGHLVDARRWRGRGRRALASYHLVTEWVPKIRLVTRPSKPF